MRSCAHKVPTTLGAEGRNNGMPNTMSPRFSSKRQGEIEKAGEQQE